MNDRLPSRLLNDLAALIGFDTTSARPNDALADWLEDRLAGLGFDVERVVHKDAAGTPKVNLVARRGEGRGGMAYFGHSDCVAAPAWTGPATPWTMSVCGNRIYGRGACDMKGSLAAMLHAAESVQGERLARPLYFVCTADEEVGYLGAEAVAASSCLYEAMVAGQPRTIVGEPTRLRVVHAHKGGVVLEIISRGKAAHSSTAEGVNAHYAMIPFLNEMKAIYDETLANATYQDHRFDPPFLSWNITVTDDGAPINMTPPVSRCRVYFRPMPGVDHRPLLERMQRCADRLGLAYRVCFESLPVWTEPDRPIVRELLDWLDQPSPDRVSYGTDACRLVDLHDLVILGPGDIAQAHTDDEWIERSQLERGAELFELLIRRWCQ